MDLDRRTLLALGAAVAAVPLLPVRALAQATSDPSLAPFLHGVASGDPLSDRVVLWTRTTAGAGPVPVSWVVARDAALTEVVRAGTTVADPVRDHTVKVDVDGLPPATTLWYAFVAAGRRSPVGRTRTAPAGRAERLRYAVVTCSKYDAGFFNAYARVAEADVDAVLHLGDYLYEGGTAEDAPPGRQVEPDSEVRTLQEYRTRHALYKTDPDLQRAHQSHPFVTVWDDHESSNDSWAGGAGNHDPATEGPWAVRKAAAQQAYDEWMPVRLPEPGNAARVHRALPQGALADLVVVDTRLEGRSQQVATPAEVATDPAVADPARQLYSPAQRAWFEGVVQSSTADWRLVLNQVLVSQLRLVGVPGPAAAVLQRLGGTGLPGQGVALAADTWDGYVAERERLLGFLRSAPVADVVVLTGDLHFSLANDLTEDPFDLLTPPVAVEMVTPSVTSTNLDEELGVPPRTVSPGLEAVLRAANPSTRWVELDSHGWVLLDVTAERVQGEWWFVDTVRERSAGQRLGASWVVRRGAARLEPGGPATAGRADRPALPPPPQVVAAPAPTSPASDGPAPGAPAPAGPPAPTGAPGAGTSRASGPAGGAGAALAATGPGPAAAVAAAALLAASAAAAAARGAADAGSPDPSDA